jgi:periplasmic divalent cation tolerance protein
MTDLLQVFTTLPSREQADEMARQLVEGRLAACVQVLGPLESTYRWQGKLERSQEWLLLIKSTMAAYAKLEEQIRKLHHYEVPEILAVPIASGNAAYFDWVRQEVGGHEG